MNRIQIVQDILNRIKGRTYLEIGSAEGISFFPINAKRKIAVDPHFKIKRSKILKRSVISRLRFREEIFFETTSDDFFLKIAHLLKKEKPSAQRFLFP